MTTPRLNGDLLKHNDRVRSVLERLLVLTDYRTAFLWMTEFNRRFDNNKPIDMIDDDEKYERLLGALNELEEGRPS